MALLVQQRIGHVLFDGHGIEQRAFLKQHADLAADFEQLPLAHGREILAEDEDLAGIGPHQAQRGLQQHGLAAAGRAQNHARFALAGLERDVR